MKPIVYDSQLSMKPLILAALTAIWAWPAQATAPATDGYPPGLFKHSPETPDHPAPGKRWTHLPDGRWMFVDPDHPLTDRPTDPPQASTPGQMCDFEHHCYPDTGASAAPAKPSPETRAPAPAPSLRATPFDPPPDAGPDVGPYAGPGEWGEPPFYPNYRADAPPDYRDFGQPRPQYPQPNATEPLGRPPAFPDAEIPPDEPYRLSGPPAGPYGPSSRLSFGDMPVPPDAACARIRHQLFHDLWQVYQAHQRCGP